MSLLPQPVRPRVHVVVPTRNNRTELGRCLASLMSQTAPVAQIVVCVDGSTDGTLEDVAALATADDRVRLLTHDGNAHRGRAATRNLALSAIDEGYVWFVDSDMVLDESAAESHLDVAASRVVSVGVVDYQNASDQIWAGYLQGRGRHRYPDGASLPYTQFTTANSLVPAVEVKELNGFDCRFSTYGGEDIEFALRLEAQSHLSFINNRKAVATTAEAKTVAKAMEQFELFGATNLQLLERLHPDAPKMFELHRLGSAGLADRLFRAAQNPATDVLAQLAVRLGPASIRNQALNYQVVRAVWRGYRLGLRDFDGSAI